MKDLVTSRDAAAMPVPRWYSHGRNRLAAYRASALLAASLPRPARLALARCLGLRASGWFPIERACVRANLARVAPHAGEAAHAALHRSRDLRVQHPAMRHQVVKVRRLESHHP